MCSQHLCVLFVCLRVAENFQFADTHSLVRWLHLLPSFLPFLVPGSVHKLATKPRKEGRELARGGEGRAGQAWPGHKGSNQGRCQVQAQFSSHGPRPAYPPPLPCPGSRFSIRNQGRTHTRHGLPHASCLLFLLLYHQEALVLLLLLHLSPVAVALRRILVFGVFSFCASLSAAASAFVLLVLA
jgi:hypothetical protein